MSNFVSVMNSYTPFPTVTYQNFVASLHDNDTIVVAVGLGYKVHVEGLGRMEELGESTLGDLMKSCNDGVLDLDVGGDLAVVLLEGSKIDDVGVISWSSRRKLGKAIDKLDVVDHRAEIDLH